MRLAILAFALLAVGTGCKKPSSLVGKWSGPALNGPANSGMTTSYEFKEDKGFAMTSGVGKASVALTGDYTLEGESLTIDMKDVKFTGIPKELEPAARAQFKGVMSKPLKGKVTFVTDDSVSFLAEGSKSAATTLTRVKEGS